jgi:hypothetical protein
VKGHEAGLRVQGEQERGDVAEAEQDLGGFRDRLPVEQGQQAGTAPAATDAMDRPHFQVREHSVQIGGALLVGSGEVAVAREQVGPPLRLESERGQGLGHDLDVDGLPDHAGRVHEAHGVSRP